MARPKGQYEKNKVRLLIAITHMANMKGGWCVATTAYFAKAMKIGTRQVEKYLSDLKKSGLIEIQTSEAKTDFESGKFYRKRKIRPTFVKTNATVREIPMIDFKFAIKEVERLEQQKVESLQVFVDPNFVIEQEDLESLLANDLGVEK